MTHEDALKLIEVLNAIEGTLMVCAFMIGLIAGAVITWSGIWSGRK